MLVSRHLNPRVFGRGKQMARHVVLKVLCQDAVNGTYGRHSSDIFPEF